MYKASLLGFSLFLIVGLACAGDSEPKPAEKLTDAVRKRLDEIIKQLDADDAEIRERASAELAKANATVLSYLKEVARGLAGKKDGLEQRGRLAKAVMQIERRIEQDQFDALPAEERRKITAMEAKTKSLMKSIETASAAYEFDTGFFPADEVTTADGKKLNGAAALYYSLCSAFRVEPKADSAEVKHTKDMGPYIDAANCAKENKDGVKELVDPWGQPIVYDNVRDDAKTETGYTSGGENDPRKRKTANPQGVDLFSWGAPGFRRPIANFKTDP